MGRECTAADGVTSDSRSTPGARTPDAPAKPTTGSSQSRRTLDGSGSWCCLAACSSARLSSTGRWATTAASCTTSSPGSAPRLGASPSRATAIQPAAQRQMHDLGSGSCPLLVPLPGLTDYELPAQSGRAIRDLFQRGARQCEVATAAVRSTTQRVEDPAGLPLADDLADAPVGAGARLARMLGTREADSQPLRVTGRVRVVRPLDDLLSVATLVRAACNLWTRNRTGSITERGSTQQPKSGASPE